MKFYSKHKKSLDLIKSKNNTTLSIEYWTLKQKQQGPRLTCEIKEQRKVCNHTLKNCNLAELAEQEVRSNISMSPPKPV